MTFRTSFTLLLSRLKIKFIIASIHANALSKNRYFFFLFPVLCISISSLPIRPVKESPALSFFNSLIIILLRVLVNQDNTQKQRIYTLSTLLRLRSIRINYLVTILILYSTVQH
ncbi:hypothetical protein wTpre_261 [Wolbachia endosymbiont of Trichogramma pretiosum]|nr:hypothetical protein wTpre_261 [Wolbachia endosymbiont of Trichogramma pretiosum]